MLWCWLLLFVNISSRLVQHQELPHLIEQLTFLNRYNEHSLENNQRTSERTNIGLSNNEINSKDINDFYGIVKIEI